MAREGYFLQSISVDQCSLYLLCCIYVSPLGLLGQLGSLHQLVLLCHVACKIVLSSLNMSLFKGGGGRYPGAGTLTLAPALQCHDRCRQEAGGLVTVSPCQALCEAPGPGLPVCAGLLVSSSVLVSLCSPVSAAAGLVSTVLQLLLSPAHRPARTTDSTAGVKTDRGHRGSGSGRQDSYCLTRRQSWVIAAVSTLACWPICSCRVAGAV